MEDFDDAAKVKKTSRIQAPFNPDNLSENGLLQLENRIKASLKDGYLSCPAAWKIAQEASVTKVAVGELSDRLGIRVTDCQIGFFKKSKTPHNNGHGDIGDEAIGVLKQLSQNNQLTCAMVFDLAQRFKIKPIKISHEAGAQGLRIRECQLGCF